jgi:hypothetical protein
MTDFVGRARSWLDTTYGGLVVLADPEPIKVTNRARLFGCRYAESDEPMLAATICVPSDGGTPFPASNSAPLDDDVNFARVPGVEEPWRWRANALSCVIAMKSVAAGRSASASAWQPVDEAPGWWDRLLAEHFPAAELAICLAWTEVAEVIVDGGAGTHGVVWLRRQVDGREVTGHLLYTTYDEESDGVVLFDPQRGTLVSPNGDEVEEIVLAHFHHDPVPAEELPVAPWQASAGDFVDAVAKATSWLDFAFDGNATLVAPGPEDERERGWLFACTTKRFLETGDWRDQMLDAAVVVPKAAGESPFGLPNRDPWVWLAAWDRGETDLPAPPEPGHASWFGVMVEEIPGLRTGDREPQRHWAGVLREINGMPTGAMALVWVRRRDDRQRETVGHLMWAVNRDDRVELFDPTADADAPPDSSEPFELRIFRVETPVPGISGAADPERTTAG